MIQLLAYFVITIHIFTIYQFLFASNMYCHDIILLFKFEFGIYYPYDTYLGLEI